MITTKIKPYDLGEMSVKWIEKKGDFSKLASFENPEELKAEAVETVKNGGKVFAVLEKKELVGIWIFKKEENYFVSKEEYVAIGDKKFDVQKFWFGDNSSALVLTKKYLPNMETATEEKMNKHITDTVKLYVSEGQYAGTVIGETLYFRKDIRGTKDSNKVLFSYGCGFLFGFVLGYIIFHEWWMGICFGCCYMTLFGASSLSQVKVNGAGEFDLNKAVDDKDDDDEDDVDCEKEDE